MIFHNPERKPVLHHVQGHPVTVIAAFNTIGDLIPRFFCIEDDYSELFKYKVSAVKSIKDRYMIREFVCCYDAYGIRYCIVLSFDILNRQWAIGASIPS